MKKITRFLTVFLLIFFVSNNYFAQDGGIIYKGKLGTKIENQIPDSKIVDISEMARLDDELKQAIETRNYHQEQFIRSRILELTKDNISIPNYEDRDYPAIDNSDPTAQPDWLLNDVLIYNGDIGQVGSDHRRTDLKMGEDGNLYAALIRRPETSQNGRADVFKSSDGGSNWSYVSGVTSSAYIGQISITVEVRSAANGNLDSTRIFLFYSRSPNSNFDNATINYVSFKRDGTGWKGGNPVLTPSTGNKLLYPCAVSDGQYYTTATYIGVTCGEYSNDGTQGINLHLARTTNWGDSYTTAAINDGYPTWGDWFPVSAFKNSTLDSVYIAVERRFTDGSMSQPRVLATPWSPSTGFKRYSISSGFTDEYKKPAITIVQDAASLDKKIVVASIKNGQAVYSRSMDGGKSWTLNSTFSLPTETNISYVAISSDSNATSNDYVVGAFQKANSDTIILRRGYPGSLGTRIIQPNEFRSSTFNSPNVAIYNDGGNKSSALLYTGLVSNYTSNLYFDGENLVSDVKDLSGSVNTYTLEQNYPNPFNPSTKIRFSIPEQTSVTLKIYNTIGQEVASLFSGEIATGNHEVDFNASALSSGVYFYKIQSPSFTATKKMILIK